MLQAACFGLMIGAVWSSDTVVTSRSVDRSNNTLRRKIEPDPNHPAFIETIHLGLAVLGVRDVVTTADRRP